MSQEDRSVSAGALRPQCLELKPRCTWMGSRCFNIKKKKKVANLVGVVSHVKLDNTSKTLRKRMPGQWRALNRCKLCDRSQCSQCSRDGCSVGWGKVQGR